MLFSEDVSGHVADFWTPNRDSVLTFVKCTQGADYVSPAYRDLVKKARAAGQAVGHYHCIETLDQGRGTMSAQVDRFLKEVDLQPGDVLSLDFEAWSRTSAYKRKHGGGENVLATQGEAAEFLAFLRKKAPTHRLLPYMNSSTYRTKWRGKLPLYDGLWVAHYGVTKPNTDGDPWVMWQTHAGEDLGPRGIDQNKLDFPSRAAFDTWRNALIPKPAPTPPAPAPKPGVPGPSLTIENTQTSSKYGPYGHTRSGKRVNKTTYDAVQTAADRVKWGPVVWTQGGLNAGGVAASARTHDGLDVGDISVKGKTLAQIRAFVTELMLCGIVGFIRGFVDSMPRHIHLVCVPANRAHDSTELQIYHSRYGYKNGGAGLAGAPSARWWGPKRLPLIAWEQSTRNPNRKAA